MKVHPKQEEKMKRNDKIASIKKKMENLRSYVENYEALQRELNKAERSFDVGEKVKYTELCNRGCCVEREEYGVVSAIQDNGLYQVSDPMTGRAIVSCYESDLKRI